MKNLSFDALYYEPAALASPLGQVLAAQYADLPQIPIESHNNIPALRARPNEDFPKLKRLLILGIRKTHKYTENQKISDYLVPYTSSGCTAMCLYCYLVCNYNKCAYLRLFVNREEMLTKLCRFSHKQPEPCTFEIGSNSDLVLENRITHTLEWTIPHFAQKGKGFLTFPTKFHQVEPLLSLEHGGKTIFRMSVNPKDYIRRIELGTSDLSHRLEAVNQMAQAGYPCGLLVAPILLLEDWESQYQALFQQVEQALTPTAKKGLTLEFIFMTYSFIHKAINADAFPLAPTLFDPALMKGRGRGKYHYYGPQREKAQSFLAALAEKHLPESPIVYFC